MYRFSRKKDYRIWLVFMRYFDEFRVGYSQGTSHLFHCSSVLLHNNSKFICYKILEHVFSATCCLQRGRLFFSPYKMLLSCTIISYLSDALLHCTPVTHFPLKETSVTGFQNNTQGTQISFQNLDLIHLFKKVFWICSSFGENVVYQTAIFLNKPLFVKMKLLVIWMLLQYSAKGKDRN